MTNKYPYVVRSESKGIHQQLSTNMAVCLTIRYKQRRMRKVIRFEPVPREEASVSKRGDVHDILSSHDVNFKENERNAL